MRRVNVIGSSSGAGKTTFGRALAERMGVPFIELDALHWQQGNWAEPALEVFRARVADAVGGPAWVVDGNYGKTRDIVWPRADTVVWLDLPFPLMFWRTVRRSVARRGQVLWVDNRETLRNTFFSRESLLLFMARTHRGRKRRFEAALALPEHAHLRVHRFRSTREAVDWLRTVEPVARPP